MSRFDSPDNFDLQTDTKEDQSSKLDLIGIHLDSRPPASSGKTPDNTRDLKLPDLSILDASTKSPADATAKATGDAALKAPADAPAAAASKSAIEYRTTSEYRQNPDDASTVVKIEKDAAGRNVRITDANGAASTYQTDGGNNVQSATINGKNYKGEIEKVAEIRDGQLHWKDAAGHEHHDRIQSATLNAQGDLQVQFPDGSKRIYEASGARIDFDTKGRPSSMVDANGNIYKYENYSIPGIGINAIFGGKEYPEKVTVYNPDTKKSYEFRREGQLGSATPYYNVYVDGLPLSGEMTLTAGAGGNFGPVSAGVGLSIPIDKVCQLDVLANGGIKIRNEKVGWVYNNVSEVTRNPNGSSVVEDWKQETTTCIWWGHNVQRVMRNGMSANVGNVPR